MGCWEKRYSGLEYERQTEPGKLLNDLITHLPKGKALDIACGMGRNAIFLARNGYDVDAADSSKMAIDGAIKVAAEAGVNVNFIYADLEDYLMSEGSYDLIINFYYLQRSLVPAIKRGLKKGGAILFETYTVEQKNIGPPNNPEYLLRPNELLELFSDLHISFYREGIFEEDGKKRAIASILAKKL